MLKKVTLSINSTISWALKVLMVAATLYLFLSGQLLFGGLALLSFLLSITPALVSRNYNTNLPWELDFWLTLWMALQVFGIAGLYVRFAWWDAAMHFGGTMVLVYLAFVFIYALHLMKKIRLSIPLIGFFTFLIGVAFGALWEIFEFWAWRLTGNDMLATNGEAINGLFDTFSDLQLDTAGAAVMALIGMKYVAQKRHLNLNKWLKPFFKIFGQKMRRAQRKMRVKKNKFKKKLYRQQKALHKKLKGLNKK